MRNRSFRSIFNIAACLFLFACGASFAQASSGTPALSVSSTSVNFGDVTVGQTVKKTVTLTSTGSAPVSISDISVAGSLFSASGITAPLSLNPGQIATLTLIFSSPHVSTFTGTVTVASNSSKGNVVVNMSGNGVAGTAALSVSSTDVNFGNVVAGQTAERSITLTSTGTSPVTISSLSVAGSLFAASGLTTPATLNPGQTATLTLSFTSPHVSSFTGVLTIASNSSKGNITVNMSGAGDIWAQGNLVRKQLHHRRWQRRLHCKPGHTGARRWIGSQPGQQQFRGCRAVIGYCACQRIYCDFHRHGCRRHLGSNRCFDCFFGRRLCGFLYSAERRIRNTDRQFEQRQFRQCNGGTDRQADHHALFHRQCACDRFEPHRRRILVFDGRLHYANYAPSRARLQHSPSSSTRTTQALSPEHSLSLAMHRRPAPSSK